MAEKWLHQAGTCLSALTNLNAGKQAQAGTVLERHLNEGVCRLVSTQEDLRGEQFSMPEILLLRAARDYRLQHPWTNDEPDRVVRMEQAFKMLDAPDQVKRLEKIDQVLKLPH